MLRWKRVLNLNGPGLQPRPRHGHKAVNIDELMIVFGGGDGEMFDELLVYNTEINQWYVVSTKGDIPPGCAAYGFVVDGTRIIMFGGMVESGKYSNDLYELQGTNWEWRKLKPEPPTDGELPPCPRLGHSFTMIGDKIYLFGGVSVQSDDPKINNIKYFNDLYTLKIEGEFSKWKMPLTFGESPSPRESHTGISYQCKQTGKLSLVIYGGMNGYRLGDLWLLDTDTMMWTRPQTRGTTPLPRSLHSSTLIGHRMYVFGGWVPFISDSEQQQKWKCTNTLACLNLETMTWEDLILDTADEHVPRPRAGHCTVGINSRLYVWSGRDGCRKVLNNQVRICFKDIWYLEVCVPPIGERVNLLKAPSQSFELSWAKTLTASAYILEIQKIVPVVPATSSVPVTVGSTIANNTVAVRGSTNPLTILASSSSTGIVTSTATISSTLVNKIFTGTTKISGTGSQPIPIRIVTGAVGSGGTSVVRVLTGAQTAPLFTTPAPATTIIRSGSATKKTTTYISSPSVGNTSSRSTTGTQEGTNGKKASTGIAIQTVPKINMVQKSSGQGTISATAVTGQVQSSQSSTGTETAGTQQTTQIITGTNLAIPQTQKPATTGVDQQIPIVTIGENLRTVQTGGIVTSAGNYLSSIVTSPQVNTVTTSTISGTPAVSVISKAGVKMIRGVQNGTGKANTLTLPANLSNKSTSVLQQLPQKTLTSGGKAVTVQLTGSTGVPKTVRIIANAGNIACGKVTGLGTVQGIKLVLLPPKKNSVNLFTSTGQKARTVQTIQQATVQQSSDELPTTDAAEAEIISQQQEENNEMQKSVEDSDTSLTELVTTTAPSSSSADKNTVSAKDELPTTIIAFNVGNDIADQKNDKEKPSSSDDKEMVSLDSSGSKYSSNNKI